MEDQKRYNVKAVVNLTGISAHTLRAWEKRYSAIVPIRTETNRRLYTYEDVQKLQLLMKAVNAGHSISSVANLSIKQIQELVNEIHAYSNVVKQTSEVLADLIIESVDAIKNFNQESLESILLSVSVKQSKAVLIFNYIVPLLEKIGLLWETGELKVVHEHFAVSILRTFLGGLLEQGHKKENTPKIITTTPEGFMHELGALIAAVYINELGWEAMYLGPNLPPEEIASAVIENNAQGVLLSLIYPSDDIRTGNQLKKLRKLVGEKKDIILTGKSAPAYKFFIDEINGHLVEKVSDLNNLLKSISSF